MFWFKKQNKEKTVNWQWIIEQYKKFGEFRIFQTLEKDNYIIEKKCSYSGSWIHMKCFKEYDKCLIFIYNFRYNNFKNLKEQSTYNKRVSKAKYIPPKEN